MNLPMLPADLRSWRVHLVGAKGTGVCALAELLVAAGTTVTGSDVADTFYTDAILAELGVTVREFSPDNVLPGTDLVVHSAAWQPELHPELLRARELGIPLATYPQALGALSARFDSSGICGVHGKTTTTALAGVVARALGLPATVLAGSAVGSFGDRSTLSMGTELLIAETCEYRRHFLSFRPRRILLTGVESDHQDYYPDYESILAAFVEYLGVLPPGGAVVWCADDPGAADAISRAREDIAGVPYGFKAEGPFRIRSYLVADGRASFRLEGYPTEFTLRVPGRHLALDAAGAIALCARIVAEREGGRTLSPDELERVRLALDAFTGSRRRSEILGEAGGILFMDDYAHHPTAIRTTLAGLREFHPGRRLVADFMSHTCSRTRALFGEFASAFGDADEVVMHRIYASAREAPDPSVSGASLAEAAAANGATVSYFEEPMDAFGSLKDSLRPGDLFLTMGAGDNWKLGKALLAAFREKTAAKEDR